MLSCGGRQIPRNLAETPQLRSPRPNRSPSQRFRFGKFLCLFENEKLCLVAQWANQVLAIPRIRSVALTPTIAIAADQLDMHADLADRFIVASAAETQSTLVTKDALIRALPFVRSLW
jgi:hypothetical protein